MLYIHFCDDFQVLRGTGVGLEKQATFRADGRPGMPVSPDENLRTNPGQFKRKVQDGPILREDGSGGRKKASCKFLSRIWSVFFNDFPALTEIPKH